jgi:acetylornithine deacetylase/succinyl-diaminopimelate desuccinylase-like protein
MPDKARMDATIHARRDEAIEELRRLCAVPSVSAKGEALEPCAQLVAELMTITVVLSGSTAMKVLTRTPSKTTIIGYRKTNSA